MTRHMWVVAAALVLSACEVFGVRGAPAPVSTSVSALPSNILIAQCGSPGGSFANIVYPAGWADRLAATAAAPEEPVDELLGGESEPATDRNAKPIAPPTLIYPEGLEERRVEAVCDVLLDTTPGGAPRNIEAACSQPEFTDAAERALAGVRFPERREGGRALARQGVVYPVNFCLDK
ncbi:MAG: hypothetical protein AAFX03_06600 [Pseudomonadota bacterium]